MCTQKNGDECHNCMTTVIKLSMYSFRFLLTMLRIWFVHVTSTTSLYIFKIKITMYRVLMQLYQSTVTFFRVHVVSGQSLVDLKVS